MTQSKKRAVAESAVELVEPGSLLGVGTGSTANCFIDALARSGRRIEAAVASSEATARRLQAIGIPLVELNDVESLPLYVDGADEATAERQLIKGGGGALTREKIVAEASHRFVCIVDETKLVPRLGRFPLPLEIIPMARSGICRAITVLGAEPRLREGFVTDNGNQILDVHGLDLSDPLAVEERLDRVPGIVAVGLFCRRPADLLLVAGDRGVERYG